MKTMTCKQLGGSCDTEFHAETFEEMVDLSKKHALEMIDKGDEEHRIALRETQELTHFSEGMNAWCENRRKIFDRLPQDVMQ